MEPCEYITYSKNSMKIPVCVCVCVFSSSVMSDLATPWTVALQAPLSMGFSSKNTGVEFYA